MTPAARIHLQIYCGAAIFLIVPLCFLWAAWAEKSATTPGFIVSGAVLISLLIVGRWDFASYLIRCVILVLFLAACLKKGSWPATLVALAMVLLFHLFLTRQKPGDFLALSFPLRNGCFYVAHGGSAKIINHHAVSRSQRYALDIVRLNGFGCRASGIYPRNLEAYRIFDDVVYSPCAGRVTAVVNDLPDLRPGEMDREHLAGNCIVIQLDDASAFTGLAHLRQGSIVVNVGDHVAPGQVLARVGNSGNTTEPHLHVHAKRGGRPDSMLDGDGIAIRFDGRRLVRNSLVFKSEESRET
jgi:hypothetical protein